jgi:hypothetical protein
LGYVFYIKSKHTNQGKKWKVEEEEENDERRVKRK